MAASDLTIEELKEQIKKYELQLEQEQQINVKQREKITQMSAEVVDSNPYRQESLISFKISIYLYSNNFIFIVDSWP